jgi:hypothetical protein
MAHTVNNNGACDFVTILTSATGKFLTKQYTSDGLINYGMEILFSSETQPVRNLTELAEVLDAIGPHSCLIRGKLIAGTDPHRHARRSRPRKMTWEDPITGEIGECVEQPTYEKAPHHWLSIDIDSKDDDVGWLDDIAAGRLPQKVLEGIPPELRAAAVHWRLTSSAGIKPGIRMRLFYWLDQVISDDQAKRWLGARSVPGDGAAARLYPLIDLAVFNPVEPIYCAAPIFEHDRLDPLRSISIQRSGRFEGTEAVRVPEIPPALEFSQSDPTAPEEDIAAAMAVIPNHDRDWVEWNEFGMAIWAASGGSEAGLQAFDEWSSKSEKYDPHETEARWKHYKTSPPTATGYRKLEKAAREVCPGWRPPSWDDPLPWWYADQTDGPVHGGTGMISNQEGRAMLANLIKSLGGVSPQRDETLRERLQVTTSLQSWLHRDIPPTEYICGEVFSTTNRSIIIAPTGLGKTHFSMAIAGHIAAGKDFLHWAVPQPRRVLIIDGEMPSELIKARLADLSRRLGSAPDGLSVLSREDFPDMEPLNVERRARDGAVSYPGQDFITRVIEELTPDLVVFDNIQALLTGDPKEPMTWQPVIPFTLELSRLRIGQIWVHHTGINETRGYGDKTREWQLSNVIMLRRREADNAEIAFDLEFTKARERQKRNWDDYEPVTVRLDDDEWSYERGSTAGKSREGLPERYLKAYSILAERKAYSFLQGFNDPQMAKLSLNEPEPPASDDEALRQYRTRINKETRAWRDAHNKSGKTYGGLGNTEVVPGGTKEEWRWFVVPRGGAVINP